MRKLLYIPLNRRYNFIMAIFLSVIITANILFFSLFTDNYHYSGEKENVVYKAAIIVDSDKIEREIFEVLQSREPGLNFAITPFARNSREYCELAFMNNRESIIKGFPYVFPKDISVHKSMEHIQQYIVDAVLSMPYSVAISINDVNGELSFEDDEMKKIVEIAEICFKPIIFAGTYPVGEIDNRGIPVINAAVLEMNNRKNGKSIKKIIKEIKRSGVPAAVYVTTAENGQHELVKEIDELIQKFSDNQIKVVPLSEVILDAR